MEFSVSGINLLICLLFHLLRRKEATDGTDRRGNTERERWKQWSNGNVKKTGVYMKSYVFWDITLCTLGKFNFCFEGTYCSYPG
jgi:hypothetical protein